MDENQKQNENLNEKEKAKEAILPESKMSEDKKKAKSIKTKFKTQAKKQAKGLKQKLLVGASVLATAIVLVIALVGSYNQIQPQRMGEIARSMQYPQVNSGEEDVAETGGNVEFDAFFLRDLNNDGVAEGIRGTSRTVGEEDTLYMELNVQTSGRLENGVITIEGDNFYLKAAIPRDGEIQENAIGNNIKTIKLNTIKNGTQKLLTGIVCSGDYSKPSTKTSAIGKDTSKYTGKGKVTLTGTYVPDDGSARTPFTKEVEFDVDWHGTVKAQMATLNREQNISTAINEEKGTFTVKHVIEMQEVNNELNIKKAYIETEIPQLSGYNPDTVRVTGSNVTFDYNPTTRKLTAESNAKLDGSKVITTQAYDGMSGSYRYNKFNIEIVYPLEAYQEVGSDTIEHQMTVMGYYEGYNNEHSEFPHPYKSNEVKATFVLRIKNPSGTVARFDVIVGKYVYEPSRRYIVSKEKPLRIYNGLSEKEDNDIYTVIWEGYTGSDGADKTMVMKERKDNEALVSDEFLKTYGQYDSMENLTSNIGIYFSNASSILEEDGEIKVFDDELNELLMTFNKENWSTYNANNPYTYERPVKHIRVETSATKASASLYVYNIKKLDDEYITTHYTQEKFDELQEIKSTLNGYLGGSHISTDTHSAKYEAPYTIASIVISKDTLSTQETEKNFKITLKAEANTAYNQVKWQNGAFLVKLPKDIVDVEINEARSTNNVRIVSSEQYKEGENCYIKINTENNTPTTFDVIIDCNITPDPRIKTQTETVELQYSNANAVVYWNKVQDTNDVNGNLNKTENIGKATINLNLVSPSSLLTSETITEYDSNNSTTIAPQIASVEKTQHSAKINIQLTNNYSNTISEVKILGRVPYTGNKYVINGENLGSTFNTTMQGELTLPPELQDVAKVYYSDKIDATEDVELQTNNWQQEPGNFSNIKSYLIDLGTKKIDKDSKYEISYQVTIPTGLSYNQVSYSHHAVYFSLDTTEGRYPTKTEPNKVGLMIAKQYDLELIKYQKGKSNIVPGATYLIKEENAEEGKTRVTDINGTLTLKDLYVDRTYVIKEIKSPTSYELNETEVKFRATEEGGVLKLVDNQTTKDKAKDIQVIQPHDDEGYKVQVQVEDEVKASLKIVKTVKGAGTPLNGVRFKITGKNYENGRSITTNASGEATLNGLSIGETYTLEEIKADGYYLASKITFTIKNNGGSYSVEKAEENGQNLVTSAQVQETENIPTLTLNIDNEKIPEYTLKINKVVKGEVTPLSGAKFRLFKGTEKIADYTTDGQGIITIPKLYQYEDSKNLDQTYTLKEILAPDGYAQVKDITFYVTKNAEGSLTMELKEGKVKDYTVENETNTVTITIEDSPSFKLIKKDGETSAPLPNTKFAIYNVDDGTEQLALDSKYNILGEKEEINGKTYYTLTTNDKGEIEANLREGLYKAVEIKTKDEKYEITNNVYYFGIGASREAPETMAPAWATSFGGTSNDHITSVARTSDGGYIVGGDFSGSITVEKQRLTSKGSNDGLLIKYRSDNSVEWATSIGEMNDDRITSVAQTSDGGYIVGGDFSSDSITLGTYEVKNNGFYDGLLIKYNENGEVEWTTNVGAAGYDLIKTVSATKDGGYIVGGRFYNNIIVEGKELISNGAQDGLLIKYRSDNSVEWATSFGGSSQDEVISIAQISDGGYIVGGFFSSSITVVDYKLNSKGFQDGLLIKYNENGDVKWATSFGGSDNDRITSASQTSDGGYIVGGYFYSSRITLEEGIVLKNNNSSTDYCDGLLIKYNNNNKIEWANSFGGSDNEQINSVVQTSEGEYIVGGYYESRSIMVGDYILNNNNASYISSSDGVLIKYSENGEVKLATNFGGSKDDLISSVAQTSNGGYIVGGYFGYGNITIGDYKFNNSSNAQNYGDALIIKYEPKELANPVAMTATSIGKNSSDQINTVVQTSDGGYIVGGTGEVGLRKYSNTNELEWHISNISATSVAETSDQGYIVGESSSLKKYNSLGILEWNKSISNTTINSVSSTNDGGYIVGGYFGGIVYGLETKGSFDGVLIKYSENGEVEWATNPGGEWNDYVTSVAQTSDGGYIVGGYFYSSSITLKEGIVLKNNDVSTSYNDGLLIKYNGNGNVEWATSFGSTYNDTVTYISATSDGGYIVGGYFGKSNSGNTNITIGSYTLSGKGYSDGLLIKYNSDNKVEWATNFGGNKEDEVTSVLATSDGGYIVGGYFESNSITIENYTLKNNSSSTIYPDGLLIKYKPNENTNNSNKYAVDWAKSIGGTSRDLINSAVELQDGTILAGGYYQSPTIETDGKTLTNSGNYDAMLLEIANMTGVPEVEELEVKNYVKELKITTDVEEINGEKGGSISGEDSPAYEKVKYGNSSTLDIKMTPQDASYEIIKVTINGVEQSFTPSEDGSYTLDKFHDMKENKHIVVTYAKKANKVVIKKVDSKTGNPMEGIEFKIEQVDEGSGANYHETLKTNKEGKIITELEYGKYRITEVKTPDSYAELENPIVIEFKSDSKTVVEGSENAKYENEEYVISNTPLSKVTVHHYLKLEDGTETKQEVAPDDFLYGKPGDTYQTKPHLELQKYELEKDQNGAYKTPEKAGGEYEETEIVVIYYYTLKKIPLTVHHYIVGTETKVPLANGSEADDETRLGTENEGYTTKAKTAKELNPKYEFKEVAGNAQGTYQYDEVVVTYYYAVKDSPGVLVHHVAKETRETLSADVTLPEDGHTPKYGEHYETHQADDIPENYKLVERPGNAEGNMIDKLTEVTYEYVLKDPQVTNERITKTGTSLIKQPTDEVTYKVTYSAKVSEYIGKAQVTIVDTLPCEIDVANSDLAGGDYDPVTHTITWKELAEIDTYSDGGTTILEYTKDIKVVFSNMNYGAGEITNNVKGTLKLYTPEKELPPVTGETKTKTDFKTEITVVKTWEHKNSIYERPTRIKVLLKKDVNGEPQTVAEQELTLENNKVNDDVNKWSYTFTDLPKYDEKGNIIEYYLEETEAGTGELLYYNTSIDQAQKTVTNTYKGPVISSTKDSAGKNGKDYVIEAETITYTITVRNDGGVGKEVKVQDSIPEGTTFAEGSIKVNGESSYNLNGKEIQLGNKGIQDLADGIVVMVDANSSSTVSFDVTVDNLENNVFTRDITNTATVDDKPTEPTKDVVKKPNISFRKEAEITRGTASYQESGKVIEPENGEVKENDIITYKIELTNSGEIVGTAIVKDTIPNGTEFVAKSIKVTNGVGETEEDLSQKGEEDLKTDGISIKLEPNETKILEFKVKVKAGENLAKIENTAKVNNNSENPRNPEVDTNPVTHTYVEPKITQNKKSERTKGQDYVVEGEVIKYTITVTNEGGLAKDVVIKDTIPDGTTLVKGSIQVNGNSSYELRGETIELVDKGADDLAKGFTVNVPRKEKGTTNEAGEEQEGANGQVTLSFEVTVNDLEDDTFKKEIKNKATVDDTPTDEITDTVKKPNIVARKDLSITRRMAPWQNEDTKIDPEKDEVKVNDEITYKIKLENKGEAVGTAIVKDSIPSGTEFVAGSIKVDGNSEEENQILAEKTADDLANYGISVVVEKGKTKTLEFTVTVQDITDLEKITNKATVNNNSEKPNNPEKETNPVESTYVEPLIEQSKKSETANKKDYVVEGEVITYTITVTNKGGLAKDVVIKDNVPTGTTLVPGSIKVNEQSKYTLHNSEINLENYGVSNLRDGITVNVPRKTKSDDGSGEDGKTTLTFKVTVNDLPEGEYLGEITNTATVDGNSTNPTEDTIKKPNISFEKKAEVERGVASWETKDTVQNPDSDKKVKENDTITYKIVLTNSGEAVGTALVKDKIPEETTFVEHSIRITGDSEEDTQNLTEKTADDLANKGISVVVEKDETKTLEFKVKVKKLNDQDMIRNIATVNNNSEKPENPEKDTNEVEHKYVEPLISENKTYTTDESLSYVLEGEGVTFTIVAENAGGLAKDVVIKDKIPSGTSFIPGSIKVNGISNYTYRGQDIDLSKYDAKNLSDGIAVTVPPKTEDTQNDDGSITEGVNGQTNLSFKVSINELPENIFTKQITNTAKVDEKDTNDVKVLVNKTNVTYKKTSEPETGSKVVAGDIITYRIEAQNTGTAPADIEIYDSIPEGTTYVEGSLSVKQGLIATVRRYVIDDLTKTGIDIKLKDGEKVVVEFKVKVNEDLKNGTVIRNVAEINGSPTEDVEHTVEAPNLAIQKEQKIETGENYVVKGDVIEYSIILRNDGALGAKAIIKDSMPRGTSFVEGSMRINDERIYTLPRKLERGEIKGETDEIDVSAMTEEDLKEGIEVYIGKQTELLPETLTLSFKVKVNEDAQGEIRNVAQAQEERNPQETTDPSLPPVYPTVSPSNPVDPERPDNPDKNLKDPITSNEVKCPVVTFEKQVEIHRTTEEEQSLEAGKVTANDELTYKVIVRNTGEDTAKNVEVKDNVPEGTIIKEVNDKGETKSDKEITWVIEEIPAGKEKTVSFTVIVGYSQQDRQIKNTAYVKGVETNETITEYKKPEIKLETTVVKTGDYKITSTDTPVYYELTYTATIDYFVGKATIKIVDTLPYEIDEGASSLDGGKYDKDSKTITWEEETDEIDTYLTKEAQVITRHKELSLKYIYEDEENLHGDIENTVKTTTDLKEPDPENPREDKVVKTEEQEDKHIVVAEIPTTLTVHHYFYDKELEQETKVELAPDEVKEGLVGDEYTTSKSSKVPANYECMNENPEKKEGTLTKTPIEVTYYYVLKDETAKVEVTKEATADKKVEKEEYVMDEEGRIETNEDGSMKTRKVIVPVITNEDGSITYKITYEVRIENYIGKAKIEIVDRLPAGINKGASKLQKGSYDEVAHTITWEEEIEDIDTFKNGTYEKTIEKEITIVYEGQNKASILENTVEGKVTTYYPDIHPNKPEEEKQEITDEDEARVDQDYRTDVTVEKRWDDNENVKHHRPASVKVYLTANGQKVSEDQTDTNELSGNFAQAILSEENSWKHTFENLPKYDSFGNAIEYSVEESEVNANDLEYYEDANISIVSREKTLVKVIVTNSYRLVNTEIESSITKNGTESITSSKQEVNYHVEYHAVVKDYIGESTLTVTDTLPYRIDKEKSELKGGKYDDDLQTITWTEDLGHINTVENGEKQVDFEKDIKVVFKDLDATQYEMTNHVKGRIEFTENDTKNEVEDSHITNIDVQGKVVVKYVDILTGKEITTIVKPGEPGNEEGQEDKEITYGYEIEQKVGTDYTTEQKTIPTYDYVKNSGNTEGKIIEGTIEVTYYYIRSMSGGLTVRYVDEEGNDLLPEEKIEGRIEDPYKTEQKEIENYEFTEVTGDEPEGKLGVEPKEVVYHYRKIPAKVVVRYLEKETEEVLLPEKIIEGYVGDPYETTREAVENYRAAEPEPENSQGKMEKNDQDNTIYVTYYYEKIPSGKITAKYVDIDTGEEITYEEQGEDGNSKKTYREEMQGYVGEKYVTEAKEIPYYKYLEDLKPTNGEGYYTEDDDTVMYYYRKLTFNISVEKNIVGATVNGEQAKIKDGKIIKLEVVASKALTTKVELKYEVVVKNTGELEGKAKVEENIPEGLKVSSKNPEYWKQEKGKLTKEVELEGGQEEKLEVVLEWKNSNTNFGNMNNIVKVVSTENPANYLETTEEDNTSEAEAIISVKTGANTRILAVALGTIASCGLLVLLYQYETYQKERGVAIRHVVLDGQNVVIVKKKQGKKAK